MVLNTQGKIDRLQTVLSRIESDHGRYMCNVYMKLYGCYACIFEDIPEIRRYRPTSHLSIGWPWFLTDQEGMRQRIRVLINTIDDLKAIQA